MKIQELSGNEVGETQEASKISIDEDKSFPDSLKSLDISTAEDTSEAVFGWLTNRDQKYQFFFDIDFMIELGRASGDFKRFKELLKDVKIQKSDENVEIKFLIERN